MSQKQAWMILFLIITVGLTQHACQKSKASVDHSDMHPAKVEHIDNSELSTVILTNQAALRINLQTDRVAEVDTTRSASKRKVVPYSSLIYDSQGQSWIYTQKAPLTFVRHKVDVDYIEGDKAVLNDGPPVETVVASVGVAELYGTEFKVGH